MFKAEGIHKRGPWRNFEAVEYAILEWGDWFNNRRLLEPIGNMPSAEAEENVYAALETEAIAASRTVSSLRHTRCGFDAGGRMFLPPVIHRLLQRFQHIGQGADQSVDFGF